MPNANYNAGRRLEYACMKRWRDVGHCCMRTAGSHGPFDVIAIQLDGAVVTMIQCKRTKSRATATRLLKSFAANPPIQPSSKFHQRMEVYMSSTKELLGVTV